MMYNQTEIVADDGQWWSAAVSLKGVSGSTTVHITIIEYTAAAGYLNETNLAVTVSTTEWRRFSLSRLLTNAATERVSLHIAAPNNVAATFKVDAIILTKTRHEPAYFDGDTSGASWTGTVKASTSRMGMAELHVDSNYIGDGDSDNSVVAQIKRSDQVDWISLPGINADFVLNRGTKVASALIGPSYGRYNVIENPGFELDLETWWVYNPNINASATRTTDEAHDGQASAKLTVGTGAGSALLPIRGTIAAAGQIWSARCWVKIPTGMTVYLSVRSLTSALAYVAQSPPVTGVNQLDGNDTWQELVDIWTLPATTGFVDLAISISSAVAGEILIDNVILSRTDNILIANPYLDGSMVGGVWEGNGQKSTTGLVILPETSYDFKHIYTDPDGIVDNDNTLSVAFSDSHTTAAIADNVTTTVSLEVTPSTNDIYYSATYLGDDDNDMVAVVEYKRTDLSSWTAVQPTYERPAKHVHGRIPNLKMGTSYTVRVTFTDAEGVYGTNPLTMVTNTTTDLDTGESQSTIMFGGFLLMGRPDMKIGVSEHDAFGFPERRLQIEDLPRVDGAVELSNLWGQRGISMTGFVEGEDRGELEDNKNALKRALAPKLQRLVIDTLSNQGRYYNATCESLAIVERAGENIRHLVWDAQFIAADPFAYDTELTVLPEFTAGHNATATATNIGDLRIDPTIKVRTTNTVPVTLTILNQTTGERITPSTTIVNGDRLVIDTSTLSILKNGVEIDYAGGFPHLTTGSNVFKFTVVAASGTPTVLVEMSWRHRYI
jgi:phage-related protein